MSAAGGSAGLAVGAIGQNFVPMYQIGMDNKCQQVTPSTEAFQTTLEGQGFVPGKCAEQGYPNFSTCAKPTVASLWTK